MSRQAIKRAKPSDRLFVLSMRCLILWIVFCELNCAVQVLVSDSVLNDWSSEWLIVCTVTHTYIQGNNDPWRMWFFVGAVQNTTWIQSRCFARLEMQRNTKMKVPWECWLRLDIPILATWNPGCKSSRWEAYGSWAMSLITYQTGAT